MDARPVKNTTVGAYNSEKDPCCHFLPCQPDYDKPAVLSCTSINTTTGRTAVVTFSEEIRNACTEILASFLENVVKAIEEGRSEFTVMPLQGVVRTETTKTVEKGRTVGDQFYFARCEEHALFIELRHRAPDTYGNYRVAIEIDPDAAGDETQGAIVAKLTKVNMA